MSDKIIDPDKEMKTNPNDPNQTFQTTQVDATGNEVIKSDYADATNTDQYATKPNTSTDTQKSATGSGLDAALGTEYSWNTKAEERANLDYQSKVLETKSNFLSNRQEIETAAAEAQNQFTMAKYAQNQSSEKAGWTGGYILDTDRQMSYLKETIKAQMYGQMELQKYGYDTSLAAARLAYDTNKYDLALEYYNTALSRAVSEAEITGFYVSPETSEMLNEYSIASRIMNDETASEADKQRADKVLTSVYEWFEANGISKNGVETYAHIVEERTWKKSIVDSYELADKDNYAIDKDSAFKLDENGNWIISNDGTAETINWNNMSAEDILNYIQTSDAARDQYYSRLDLTAYEVETKFTDWCIKNGYVTTDDRGNITDVNSEDYNTILQEYLKENGGNLLQSELDKFNESDPDAIMDLLSNWSCAIEAPDGSTITLSLTPSTGTSNSGVNVGDITVNEDGTTSFNYKGYYITGESGQVYVKDCKNVKTLTAVLQSNPEMAELLKLLELDPRKESYANNVSDWMNGLQAVLTAGGAAVGTVGGPIGTVIGGAAGLVIGTSAATAWDLIDDLFVQGFTSQSYKQQVDFLTATINNIESSIGTTNMSVLNEACDKYKNLSEKDRATLSESELASLKYAYSVVTGLNNYKEALKYAEMRDSNIWQDPWEFIGDNWKADMTDIWDDGYQFGDVAQTILTGAIDVVETAAAVVVGGVQWLWNSSLGSWFGWKW